MSRIADADSHFISWIYLHFRVDVHSGTCTQQHLLQTPFRQTLSYSVQIYTDLCSRVKFWFIFVVCLFNPWINISDCNWFYCWSRLFVRTMLVSSGNIVVYVFEKMNENIVCFILSFTYPCRVLYVGTHKCETSPNIHQNVYDKIIRTP